jgi:NADH-quinone oxidoreductase subunit F
VVSTIAGFREEYIAHIRDRRCPAGACKKLKRFTIDAKKCKGCSKCRRACPADAIEGVARQPYKIDAAKCVRCGACVAACPFHAVEEA